MYTCEGSLIPAKVIEISDNKIKYKKSNNLNGPLYVIDKSTITMIEYKNGTKEVFPVSKKDSSDNNSTKLTEVKAKQHNSDGSIEEILPYYYLREWSGTGWGLGNNTIFLFFR